MVATPDTSIPREHAKRNCDICGSRAFDFKYAQRFATFDDLSGLSGYDVVECSDCGFAYANYLPDQARFERYYRDLSKYEQHETGGEVSEWAVVRDRAIVSEISAILPQRNLRILDVGCATGHLLATFREAGFENVTGLDPSRRCVELARELYGIRVQNLSIAQVRATTERYDLVLVSGVLEHLRDLRANCEALASVLAKEGAIWFEVPDAGRFSKFVNSPFQQFSLEHINFFTARSLARLMKVCGFEQLAIWRPVRTVRAFDEPGLDGLFTRNNDPSRRVATPDPEGDLAAYIAVCEAVERRLVERLLPLTESRTPLIVWGTGSLTMHLLTQPRFSRLNVLAFVDSNPNYHDKTINGVPVVGPRAIQDRDESILVVSHASMVEIVADIRGRFQLRNNIVDALAVESA